jgi:hypothetical protein
VAGDDAGAQVLGVDALTVIYISIAVSIVSALCLIIGVFLRRRELLFGAGASPTRTAKAKGRKKTERKRGRQAPASTAARAADTKPAATAVTAQPARVPDEALVHVVPGRKRYHLASCRQVAGRGTEELTYVEAKEEGFSPCTACMPDTALAARAAASAPQPAEDAKSAEDAEGAKAKGAKGPKNPKSGEAKQQDGKTAEEDGPTGKEAGTTAVLSKPDAPADDSEPSASATPAPAPAAPSPVPSAWSPPAGRRDTAPRPTVTDQPVPEQARPEPADDSAETASAPSADSDPEVRILSGTKRFHRSDCALIEDIGDDAEELQTLPLSQARARGCTPCLVCQPDKAPARD